jgi:hypothetical protein
MVLSLSGVSAVAALLSMVDGPAVSSGPVSATDALGPVEREERVAANDPARSFRVRTASGTIMLLHPALTGDGVTGDRPIVGRNRLLIEDTIPVLIPWKEIECVERPSSGVGRGASSARRSEPSPSAGCGSWPIGPIRRRSIPAPAPRHLMA